MTPGGGDDWFSQQGDPLAPQPGAPPPGGLVPDPQQQMAALRQAPGYQFRMTEGINALQHAAASKGTLLTGGTLKGLNRWAQDYASGEYQNRYNQLFGLAGLGANAAGAQAGQNANYASNAGDLMTQVGNANAAGQVGSANAINQGIGGATNIAQMYFLSRLMQDPTGGGGSAWIDRDINAVDRSVFGGRR